MDKELFVHRLTAFNNHGLTPVFDFIKTRYNKDVNNFKVNLIEDIEDFNKDNFNFIAIDFHEHEMENKNISVLNREHIDLINDDVAKLVIDYSYEGEIYDGWFVNMHRFIKNNNIKASNIYFICNDQALDVNYEEWAKKFNISNINIIKMNYHLTYPSGWYREHNLSRLDYRLDKIRPKKFTCLNGVFKEFRTLLVLELFKNELKDYGYISIVGNYGGEFLSEFSLTGAIDDASDYVDSVNFEKYLNDINLYYKNVLLPKLPIVTEIEKDLTFGKTIVDFYKNNRVDVDNWNRKISPYLTSSYVHEMYINSYFNIVTETSYNWGTRKGNLGILGNCVYPTEKTFKPIFGMQPFLVVTNPGFLSHLRDLGFKTFPEFFDESYDEVKNPIERFYIIINEIKKICSLSNEELHNKYYSIFDKLEYNRNRLLEISTNLDFVVGNLFDILKHENT